MMNCLASVCLKPNIQLPRLAVVDHPRNQCPHQRQPFPLVEHVLQVVKLMESSSRVFAVEGPQVGAVEVVDQCQFDIVGGQRRCGAGIDTLLIGRCCGGSGTGCA
ncbi:MAG: hypothetical protein Kow0074_20130 [Candidatus Zixiibacteriota bacterium]